MSISYDMSFMSTVGFVQDIEDRFGDPVFFVEGDEVSAAGYHLNVEGGDAGEMGACEGGIAGIYEFIIGTLKIADRDMDG